MHKLGNKGYIERSNDSGKSFVGMCHFSRMDMMMLSETGSIRACVFLGFQGIIEGEI